MLLIWLVSVLVSCISEASTSTLSTTTIWYHSTRCSYSESQKGIFSNWDEWNQFSADFSERLGGSSLRTSNCIQRNESMPSEPCQLWSFEISGEKVQTDSDCITTYNPHYGIICGPSRHTPLHSGPIPVHEPRENYYVLRQYLDSLEAYLRAWKVQEEQLYALLRLDERLNSSDVMILQETPELELNTSLGQPEIEPYEEKLVPLNETSLSKASPGHSMDAYHIGATRSLFSGSSLH